MNCALCLSYHSILSAVKHPPRCGMVNPNRESGTRETIPQRGRDEL